MWARGGGLTADLCRRAAAPMCSIARGAEAAAAASRASFHRLATAEMPRSSVVCDERLVDPSRALRDAPRASPRGVSGRRGLHVLGRRLERARVDLPSERRARRRVRPRVARRHPPRFASRLQRRVLQQQLPPAPAPPPAPRLPVARRRADALEHHRRQHPHLRGMARLRPPRHARQLRRVRGVHLPRKSAHRRHRRVQPLRFRTLRVEHDRPVLFRTKHRASDGAEVPPEPLPRGGGRRVDRARRVVSPRTKRAPPSSSRANGRDHPPIRRAALGAGRWFVGVPSNTPRARRVRGGQRHHVLLNAALFPFQTVYLASSYPCRRRSSPRCSSPGACTARRWDSGDRARDTPRISDGAAVGAAAWGAMRFGVFRRGGEFRRAWFFG